MCASAVLPRKEKTMTNIAEIAEMDRRTVLHPFTDLKDYASGDTDPTIMERARAFGSRTQLAGSSSTASLAFIA
jgi:hypothetical protein